MERGVRYDFELGLGSVLDLVAVAEGNPQKRARIVDKLAKKRAQLKAQQIRFGGGGRAAHAVPLDELKWIAAELESPEALAAVEELHARAQAWRESPRARKPDVKAVTAVRYDLETGMGSVYDVLAMCRGAPLSKIQRPVVAPVMAKYNIPDAKIQFAGKGQKPTPVAPYETLKRIVSDHRSPGAYVALRRAASANGGADLVDDGDLVKNIRFDPATKLGALHDVCVQCGCQRSALRDFTPAVCVFAVFPGKGQAHVPAAPPDVLAAAAFHMGRPDVGAAILKHLPGRRVVYDFEAPPDHTPRSGGGWVTPDMVLAAYGEYVRYAPAPRVVPAPPDPPPPPDWHQLFMPGGKDNDGDDDDGYEEGYDDGHDGHDGHDADDADGKAGRGHLALRVPSSSWKPDSPPQPPPKRKQPPAAPPRLDVRYDFSDAWTRKLFGRFVSSLPAHARATWYYWPASATDGLRTALEDAAVGLLVDELVARGTVVVLDAAKGSKGSVSLWKLVQAAGALGREEAGRLAHTAASHLPYDTMQAKCRSDYGPWPVWRGVRGGTRFDFKTNRPLRGLIVGSDNAAIARPPAFLDAWPETRAELCRYAGAMKFGGKETFFVVRGMRLLGDDQKDLEGVEPVV